MSKNTLVFIYKVIIFLALSVVVYGFICPFLISYESDLLPVVGFMVGLIYLPLSVFLLTKSLTKNVDYEEKN